MGYQLSFMKMVLEKKLSSKEMKRYVMPKMAIKVIRQDLLCSSIKIHTDEANPDVPVLVRSRRVQDGTSLIF